MGGCKCSFVDCGISTSSAKRDFPNRSIHFFHFPIRDHPRAVQWAIYSNNMSFLDLPIEKLKNKVICDIHFKESHFMNYQREKLNKTNAVPTIYFNQEENKEIDMEIDPKPWIEENQKKPIPPHFIKTQKIDIEETLELSLQPDTKPVAESPAPKLPTYPQLKRKADSISSPSVKILNINAAKKLPQSTQVIKVSGENYTIRRVSNSPPKAQSTPKVIKHEIIQPSPKVEVYDIASMQFMEPEPISVQNTPQTLPQTPISQEDDTLKSILLDSVKQISELKQIIEETKPQAKKENPNISQSHLNKVQLFNGIKRYLSPSMNALLRIELFSAPNRDYKKDEKIICQELLDLGEKTYDFFTEEWRLRLPAKNEVEQWKQAEMTEEDDDAC